MVHPARALIQLVESFDRKESFDPFAPDAAQKLEKKATELGLDEPLDAALNGRSSWSVAALAAQVLAIRGGRSAQDESPELVLTLPTGAMRGTRATSTVVEEMLLGATREVLLLGYEITEEVFLRRLWALPASVSLRLVCDRERSSLPGILEGWPRNRPVQVYQNLFHPGRGAPFEKMHSKVLLIDHEDLLATSANFTFHGLRANVEFGVRIRGSMAREAGDVLRALVARRDLFERVEV